MTPAEFGWYIVHPALAAGWSLGSYAACGWCASIFVELVADPDACQLPVCVTDTRTRLGAQVALR